jgi:hypothetical protein
MNGRSLSGINIQPVDVDEISGIPESTGSLGLYVVTSAQYGAGEGEGEGDMLGDGDGDGDGELEQVQIGSPYCPSPGQAGFWQLHPKPPVIARQSSGAGHKSFDGLQTSKQANGEGDGEGDGEGEGGGGEGGGFVQGLS